MDVDPPETTLEQTSTPAPLANPSTSGNTSHAADSATTPSFPLIYHPQDVDPDIIVNPLLSTFNLCINSKLGVMVCRECGFALQEDTAAIVNHVRDIHKEQSNRSQRKKLKENLEGVLSGYLKTTVETQYKPDIYPSPPLSYIKVHKGFTCSSKVGVTCFYSAETERSVLDHIKSDHSGDTSYEAAPTKIQTLFPATRRLYFPVILPSQSTSSRALTLSFTQAKKTMENVLTKFAVKEQHLVPFFRLYRWHDKIAGIDKETMVLLISPKPMNAVEELVKEAVYAYISDMNDELKAGQVHSWVLNNLAIRDSETG